MQVDYNKLATFVLVAKEMSITKAAKKLFLTQQAVSHQIKALEQELEVQLLKRAERKIFLTPVGKKIFYSAREQLQIIDNSILDAKENLSQLRGTIRIGMVPEIGRHIILPKVLGFQKTYHNIHLEFHFLEDTKTEEQITVGALDIGFVVFSSDSRAVLKIPFQSEPFVTVASKSFLRRQEEITHFSQLKTIPVIDSHIDAPSFKLWVSKNDKKTALELKEKKAVLAFPDSRSIVDLVLKNLGVAVIPQTLALDPQYSKDIVEILPNSKKISANIDLILFNNATPSLALSQFKEYMLEKTK